MWVLALLTVMALGLTTTQRTQSALSANQLDDARFRAQGDAALNLVALNLLSTPLLVPEDPEAVWVPDGQPHRLLLDGVPLELRLFDEAARLNLNSIPRNQLATLIELVQGEEGFDALQRDQLADAILDWRDADDLALLNGAEDADYRAAGLPFGARDAPFRSVVELQQVLGMTATIYQRLASHLTVADTGGRVAATYATAEVLAVTQGLLLEDARQRVAERDQALFPDEEPAAAPRDRGGPLYRIQLTQQRADGPGRSMQALLRVPGEAGNPFEVLWRRYGLVSPSRADAGYTDGP
jgi:general secretion pathway protein K